MFRELQEGLLEAESRPSTRNAGRRGQALADDGIPPVCGRSHGKGRTHDWRLIVNGAFVNYLGCRAARARQRGSSSCRNRSRERRPIPLAGERSPAADTVRCCTSPRGCAPTSKCRRHNPGAASGGGGRSCTVGPSLATDYAASRRNFRAGLGLGAGLRNFEFFLCVLGAL